MGYAQGLPGVGGGMKKVTYVVVTLALLLGVVYILLLTGWLPLVPRGGLVKVNVLIDYGNGTRVWYNGTVLERGSTVLDALLAVADVEFEVGAYGAYVTSINGGREVRFDGGGRSWMWYLYSEGGWVLGPTAADRYHLTHDSCIKWAYT
ncbi:MAG: hypothetical protein DRO06_04230, partial [Thermoproteota archaeon]